MGKGTQTKERILDTAVCMASRDGLGGLTIGKLASELSLSKAGLFAHFGSKEALQTEVLEHAASQYQERVLAPLPAVSTGRARLKALLKGCMDWIDDPSFPGGCPIMSACFELTKQNGEPWDVLVAKQRTFQARLTEMFRDCMPKGTDAEQLAFEFRGITLAYQHASRVLGNAKARRFAMRTLDAMLARSADN